MSTAGPAGVQATAMPAVRLMCYMDKVPAIGSTVWAEDVNPVAGFASLVTTMGQGNKINSIAPYNYNTHGTRYEILHNSVHLPKWDYVGIAAGDYSISMASHNFEIILPMHGKIQTWYGDSYTECLLNQPEWTYVIDQYDTATMNCDSEIVWYVDTMYEDVI